MFIVWGKKLVRRSIGHVADFCPICRGPRPFVLTRVGSAGHVYYISSGEGELVGYERQCGECKTAFGTDPATYATVSKQRGSLDDLLEQTYPNFREALADRLALEERIRQAPATLSPQERHALVRNPFLLLSPKVERRFAATHLDKEVGFAIVAALALMVVVPALARVVAPDSTELALLGGVLLGAGLVIWQIAASGRRFMRRQVVPVLATTLRPLHPTTQELATVLAELKLLRHKMATKLPLDDLQRQLG